MEYERYGDEHDLGHVDGDAARDWCRSVVPGNESECFAGDSCGGDRQRCDVESCDESGNGIAEPVVVLAFDWGATADADSDAGAGRRVVREPGIRVRECYVGCDCGRDHEFDGTDAAHGFVVCVARRLWHDAYRLAISADHDSVDCDECDAEFLVEDQYGGDDDNDRVRHVERTGA